MSKAKLQYYCTAGGSLHTKWGGYAGEQVAIRSLHRVLGGGLVADSVVLMGGDPASARWHINV